MIHILDDKFFVVPNLKWLPWVGEEYLKIPSDKKLLIVGESHYHNETEESQNAHDSITFTREVVEELAIDRYYYSTKFFPNLHKALFRNDEFDTIKFWHLVSFYNFIQRPMKTNAERPIYEDYNNGWKVFTKVVEILKPEVCLFIGTTAANSLEHSLQQTDLKTTGIVWEDFISNSYARSAELIHLNGDHTQLIFIRHCSQMFSWDNWNKYLKKKMTSQISWLEEQVNN